MVFFEIKCLLCQCLMKTFIRIQKVRIHQRNNKTLSFLENQTIAADSVVYNEIQNIVEKTRC